MFKHGDIITYRGCRGRVTQAGRDGTWAVIHIDGAKHGKKVSTAELTPWVEPEKTQEPPVLQVDRQEFQCIHPLCDHCRFATALCCPYFGTLDIVTGIARTGCKTVACQLSGSTCLSFKVVGCKRHINGPLPLLQCRH